MRREAGYCCGVRAASLGVCVHMVLYAVCAGWQSVQQRAEARARARARAGVRARLRGAGSASHSRRVLVQPLMRCQKQSAEPAQGAKRRRCAGEVCCGARVAA